VNTWTYLPPWVVQHWVEQETSSPLFSWCLLESSPCLSSSRVWGKSASVEVVAWVMTSTRFSSMRSAVSCSWVGSHCGVWYLCWWSQELMTFGALGGFMRSHSALDSLIFGTLCWKPPPSFNHHATPGEDSLPSVILFNARISEKTGWIVVSRWRTVIKVQMADVEGLCVKSDGSGRIARGGNDQPLTNAVFLRAQCDTDNCRQEVSGIRKITDWEPDGNSSLVVPLCCWSLVFGCTDWCSLWRIEFATVDDFKSEKSVIHHRNSTTTTPLTALKPDPKQFKSVLE